ncbi:hypothetical protein B0H19DRAFT_1221960 [Mycena capillaripes]|nr:hypothetical protein B0H19DRAFT_1221960 [Mycena capillaripes]
MPIQFPLSTLTLCRYLILFWLLVTSVDHAFASVDFPICFAEISSGAHGTTGGRDNEGNPVDDITKATAITYDLCIHACGRGCAAFSWTMFSPQFSAWLLPWPALVLQFPFGSRLQWDDCVSIILAIGSPCLAVYSLCLGMLNNNWVARRFDNIKYPNKAYAALVLLSLQQTSLRVTSEGGLLASLVVLPDNDEWWKELVERLSYAHTWSITGESHSSRISEYFVQLINPGVTSVLMVVVAYGVTIADAFSTLSTDPNRNGPGFAGVGCIWLWMLPVTVGYLLISPRCDAERITRALNNANKKLAYVASSAAPVKADSVNEMYALSLHPQRGSLYRDQEATAPIYNYDRVFAQALVVEEVAFAFQCATEKANKRIAVNSDPWVVEESGENKSIHPANRTGLADQVKMYCPPYARRSPWGPEVFSRCFKASMAAFALQWCTSGASILVVYATPTVGQYFCLGCRSLAYLLYASVATLIWAILVVSSILSHYATTHPVRGFPDVPHRLAAYVSILLRRFAKILAVCNTVWIVTALLLQFGNFFDRCWCNSNVLVLGKQKSHNVMFLGPDDISAMKTAWIGGVVLGLGGSGLFLTIFALSNDPPLPP